MDFSSFLRMKKAGADRRRRYRPVLEPLEDRHLLSAGFNLVNLVSDIPGRARFTDPNLVNPWGIAASPTGPFFLYAADFSRGTVEIFDQDFRQVVRLGSFQDPNLPAGYAPFNIVNINNFLFVTYAQQAEDRSEDVAGPGHGFIDVYDTAG